MKTGCSVGLAAALLIASPAHADEAPVETVTVVAPTPIPGGDVDPDKLPQHIVMLDASDLAREGVPSLTGALDERLAGVSINDDLDDPFQPDILYHGFEASPVLGTSEGLAVYQDGVRVNEAFGDTVNWDLIPDFAIARVTVTDSDPAFGLNALGGAVAVTMKDGFSATGGNVRVSGGSWGQHEADLDYGANDGTWGFYVALRGLGETGWREFSPDSLAQFYGDLSVRNGPLSLDASFAAADNHLDGESAAPIQELNVDRALVFTRPQSNADRLDFGTLRARYAASGTLSFQANIYLRDFRQSVLNGNTTNYVVCAAGGMLCQPGGATPLTDQAGSTIPDLSAGGTLPLGEDDLEFIQSLSTGAALQTSDSDTLLGHGNALSAGASFDHATTGFRSSTDIGTINGDLQVLASGYDVATPEGTPWQATPVLLHASSDAFGLYATDTFDITQAISTTASLRYNDVGIALSDRRGTALDGRPSYHRLNPAFGATARLASGATAYAGYAEADRAPTPSEIECSNPAAPCLLPSNLSSDPPGLRQVVSHSWDAGLRGREAIGDAHLTWDASLFRTDVDHDIYGVATSLGTGYFQNIGGTRRQGADLSLGYAARRWQAWFDYSYIAATFQSSFLLPSPQNAAADSQGDIAVRPGDVLPGIPNHRVKLGADFALLPDLSLGGDLRVESGQYYRGDESNRMKPLGGFAVLDLYSHVAIGDRVALFVTLDNALDARYATFGVLGDPTGIGAPGIPAGAATNGPGVDNRFESPAAPRSIFAGFQIEI